ncbi:ATP-binding protein [Paenibacillus lycopersici]|nr:ATP-binding protein [Paenibacillus lycopersici]
MTVGKTHSGKTTFARSLERELPNAVVIDQDHHAGFLAAYYKPLLPQQHSNALKHAITQTIVEYAIAETDKHVLLCNSNLDYSARKRLLDPFHAHGFSSILVYFDLPSHLLHERVAASGRSAALGIEVSFDDVLDRQEARYDNGEWTAPGRDETHARFVIDDPAQTGHVKQRILRIIQASADNHPS